MQSFYLNLDEHNLIKERFFISMICLLPLSFQTARFSSRVVLCLRRGRDVVAAAMALFFAAPQARADVGEGGVQERRCVETSYFYIFLHGIGSIYLHEWPQFLVNVGADGNFPDRYIVDTVDGNQKSGIHSPVEVGTSGWNPIIYKVFAPSLVSAP